MRGSCAASVEVRIVQLRIQIEIEGLNMEKSLGAYSDEIVQPFRRKASTRSRPKNPVIAVSPV